MLSDLTGSVSHITRHKESLPELDAWRNLRCVIILLYQLTEWHFLERAQRSFSFFWRRRFVVFCLVRDFIGQDGQVGERGTKSLLNLCAARCCHYLI